MSLTGAQHLYGDTMEVKATIRETITVAPGNIMILNSVANMVISSSLSGASSTADYYAYPINTTFNMVGMKANVGARLLGIAMNDSAKVTSTIAIATAGVFRFPLDRKAGVTLGSVASSVSNAPFVVTSSSTGAYTLTGSKAGGTTIGRFVKTQGGASNADVMIRTLLGSGEVIV